MKAKKLITILAVCASLTPAFAGTITFDNGPTDVDLGSYYQGVTFAPTLQAIGEVLPYFPAHSGEFTLQGTDVNNGSITFTFATPQSQFSFWYLAEFGFSATAYAVDGVTAVGTFHGAANVNMSAILSDPSSFSANTQVGLTNGVADISKVVITDTFDLGGFVTVDDLTAPGLTGLAAIPDRSATVMLLGASSLGLFALRRKLATA